MMMMMKMNCFCEWLIDQKRLSLFPAGIIVKDSYHIKSSKCREQLLNVHKTHFRLCRIKLRSNDTHFTKAHVIIIANHISDKLISTKLFRLNEMLRLQIVGNKAKEWIWERVFQENKARQIFRKTNISYPLIRTRSCAYQGVRNVHFSENLAHFVFLKHPFWDSPFYLITNEVHNLIGLIPFSL